MENASKALIIAGAILIAILLISVGIMVMNSTSGVTDQVGGQMDALGVQQFNSKFDPYLGTNKTANDVKGLISAVIASNGSTGVTVTVRYTDVARTTTTGNSTARLGTIQTLLNNRNTYNISVNQANASGQYTRIDVVEQ